MVVIHRMPIDKLPNLSHHGIKGQKWGKKNGPPYPLDYEAHSSAEKKSNAKLTIDGNAETGKKRKGLTDEQKALAKKILKGVAITAGVAAVLSMNYDRLDSDSFEEIIDLGKNFVLNSVTNVDQSQLGKSIKQIDKKMVESINSDVEGTWAGSVNCVHTSTAYVLNSLFGYNVKALGNYGIDEVSGMVADGRDINVLHGIFDGINVKSVSNQSFENVFSNLKPGSTGILHVQSSGGKHVINYEKDSKGNVSVVDAQRYRSKVMDGQRFIANAQSLGFSPLDVVDFSNASIRSGAENVLKHIVK